MVKRQGATHDAQLVRICQPALRQIDDWADYGAKFLGLQLVERTKSALKFRMDDRKQRIVISSEEDGEGAFGWEVADAPALDALAGRLEAARSP